MGNDLAKLDDQVRRYMRRIGEDPRRNSIAARDIAREIDATVTEIGRAIPRVEQSNPEITLRRVTSSGCVGRWEVSLDG